MDLTDPQTVKSLLARYGVRPRKYLGQHFLIDRPLLEKIIAAADISPKETVLEIGPGLGVLTLELAKRAQKIITVEKDAQLAKILINILAEEKIANTEIITDDILKIDPRRSDIGNSYKIVANLPYYLTARVIRKFLEIPPDGGVRPSEMILTVQKEVAERICARPPKMSLLAVSVQYYGEPQIVTYAERRFFWPEPKVDSAIIKIKINETISGADTRRFFRLVRAGFSAPRKKLAGNLSKNLNIDRETTEKIIRKIGLGANARAQELTVDNWLSISFLIGNK